MKKKRKEPTIEEKFPNAKARAAADAAIDKLDVALPMHVYLDTWESDRTRCVGFLFVPCGEASTDTRRRRRCRRPHHRRGWEAPSKSAGDQRDGSRKGDFPGFYQAKVGQISVHTNDPAEKF